MLVCCLERRGLAVPSDGSNPMQPVQAGVITPKLSACSTLRRVEPYATTTFPIATTKWTILQYPQTGRTLCNHHTKAAERSTVHLAVPSDGSTPLQRARSPSTASQGHSCSTLRRVEPYATISRISSTHYVILLQFPQAGRTLCNEHKSLVTSSIGSTCSTLRRV